MINFEEEIAKFEPSLEIDEAQEAILNTDIRDIADVIDKLIQSKGAAL